MPDGSLQDPLHRLDLLISDIGVDRGRHTLSMVANASCLPSRLLGPVCFLYDSMLIAIGAYITVALFGCCRGATVACAFVLGRVLLVGDFLITVFVVVGIW